MLSPELMRACCGKPLLGCERGNISSLAATGSTVVARLLLSSIFMLKIICVLFGRNLFRFTHIKRPHSAGRARVHGQPGVATHWHRDCPGATLRRFDHLKLMVL